MEYRLNSQIEIQPTSDGKTLVLNKFTNKIYELGQQESAVLSLIDGTNTPDEIAEKCGFYSEQEIRKLEDQLSQLGIIEKEDSKKQINFLKIKIHLFSPSKVFHNRKFLEILYHLSRSLNFLFILIAIFHIASYFLSEIDLEKAAYIQAFKLQASDFIILYFIIFFSFLLHEAGHMLTALHYKINVSDAGIMLYCFIPCAYTDLTYMTFCSHKFYKLKILFAGCLMDIGTMCFAMTLFYVLPVCAITRYCLFIVLFNMLSVICNLCIFLKFDGYYIFQVLLDEENLQTVSLKNILSYLRQCMIVFKNRDKKVKSWIPNSNESLEHFFYIVYGVLSVAYIPLVISSGILPVIIQTVSRSFP